MYSGHESFIVCDMRNETSKRLEADFLSQAVTESGPLDGGFRAADFPLPGSAVCTASACRAQQGRSFDPM